WACANQLKLQGVGDRARDFVLHGEDALQFALEGLRPDMKPISRKQLRSDANPVAIPAQTSFQHILDVELLRDLRCVSVLTLEREGRSPGDHAQPLNLREGIEQLFADAVAEIFLIFRLTQIHERKDGDALFRCWRGLFSEAIENQKTDHEHQYAYDREIKLSARAPAIRLVGRHFIGSFD